MCLRVGGCPLADTMPMVQCSPRQHATVVKEECTLLFRSAGKDGIVPGMIEIVCGGTMCKEAVHVTGSTSRDSDADTKTGNAVFRKRE